MVSCNQFYFFLCALLYSASSTATSSEFFSSSFSSSYCPCGPTNGYDKGTLGSIRLVGETIQLQDITNYPKQGNGSLDLTNNYNPVVDLVSGSTYKLSIQFYCPNFASCSLKPFAWIDFNGNNIFETSESLITTDKNKQYSYSVDIEFTIPTLDWLPASSSSSLFKVGITRMRVIAFESLKILDSSSNDTYACLMFTQGGAKDFSVNLKNFTWRSNLVTIMMIIVSTIVGLSYLIWLCLSKSKIIQQQRNRYELLSDNNNSNDQNYNNNEEKNNNHNRLEIETNTTIDVTDLTNRALFLLFFEATLSFIGIFASIWVYISADALLSYPATDIDHHCWDNAIWYEEPTCFCLANTTPPILLICATVPMISFPAIFLVIFFLGLINCETENIFLGMSGFIFPRPVIDRKIGCSILRRMLCLVPLILAISGTLLIWKNAEESMSGHGNNCNEYPFLCYTFEGCGLWMQGWIQFRLPATFLTLLIFLENGLPWFSFHYLQGASIVVTREATLFFKVQRTP